MTKPTSHPVLFDQLSRSDVTQLPASSTEIYDRLHRQFESLSNTRDSKHFPVFAKEHGLSKEDLTQVQSILRSRCKTQFLQATDWLLWVVYATEVGYDYTGEEYWRSFEEKLPTWQSGARNQIKKWFLKFHNTYNGVLPTGPWAEHFTIIAWPITHAILPRYLQRQFARALYDLRYHLASMMTLDPQLIGRLLTVNAHMPSTRFREFLQQEELVGRIVLALLGESTSDFNPPIHPLTLERIIEDVDNVRTSREWLEETRRITSDRFKGIHNGPWRSKECFDPPLKTPPTFDSSNFSIRPSILLRHNGRQCWSLVLDVPSFRNVATLNAEIHSVLKNSRCKVNGTLDMKPGGWLLSGKRRVVLQSWPNEDAPLLQLENSHPKIDQLLQAECRLTQGPIWLFRIGVDGIARQIKSCTVRPGYDYVLLSTEETLRPHESMSSCTLNCHGVTSFRLNIPSHVSTRTHSWLNDIGLRVARTIRVWPAGLPGHGWDGEGNSEWLTTEKPTLGLAYDHPVEAFVLQLNADSEEHIVDTNGTTDPIFVQLPSLPVGSHDLSVKARHNAALSQVVGSQPAEGFAKLRVREPEPWTRGIAFHPGLIVTKDPLESDLETFRKNEVRLSVLGPRGYFIDLAVELIAVNNTLVLRKSIGNDIGIPITPEKWFERFEHFLNRNSDFDIQLDKAERARLVVDGGTLGNCLIDFEREFKPLRWVTRRNRRDTFIQLADDCGYEDTEARVLRYNIEFPLRETKVATESFVAETKVEPSGSLFFAEHRRHFDAIAVSTIATNDSFQGLGFSPEIDTLKRDDQAVLNALNILKRWQEARQVGFQISTRHQKVIDCILAAIYNTICGSNWAGAETKFCDNPNSPKLLEELTLRVVKTSNFASVLVRDWSNVAMTSDQCPTWFAEILSQYGICHDADVCDFAYRLGCQPNTLSVVPLHKLNSLISQVLSNPATLRSARLLALSTKYNTGGTFPPER